VLGLFDSDDQLGSGKIAERKLLGASRAVVDGDDTLLEWLQRIS
jgi:hypothetical protein